MRPTTFSALAIALLVIILVLMIGVSQHIKSFPFG